VFVLVMLLSASVDYVVAMLIERTDDQRRRRCLLAFTLMVNLGLLAYFKYLLFAIDNLEVALSLLGHPVQIPHPEIILPLGISFYTFETISYVVDVYRRVIPAERSLVRYVCFVTFFPKLIAGPILRAAQLIPQFGVAHRLVADDVLAGLQAIAIGLFLKGGFADGIAGLVDDGFQRPAAMWSAWDTWAMATLFGIQIYFDFAAYSMIAIGSSRLMGIRLPENFNFPYAAVSPRDFWKRWHISLSGWIRDYLYLPLSGQKFENRAGLPSGTGESGAGGVKSATMLALFLTWAVMGLWHGANWTFVMWGLMHASLIAVYRLTERWRVTLSPIVRNVGGMLFTLPMVLLAWIPFRAASAHDALVIIGKVFDPRAYFALGLRENTYLVAVVMLAGVLLAAPVHRFLTNGGFPGWLRIAGMAAAGAFLVPMSLVFLRPITQFIYFQF
jgi:D-alanyl-lipoteichoic acid acyltransferase DltB (MBOAT superfamily)